MDTSLLEALATAVRELHPNSLDRLEARLATATASPQTVIALALDLPQRDQRDTLSRVAERWKSSFPEIGPISLVAAIQALRYATRYETRAEVCWSGPVTSLQGFRTTTEAYRELITRATRTALVVSFALTEVEALRESLEAALNRGVQVRLIVEDFDVFKQVSRRSQLAALGTQVLDQSAIFVWPRSNRRHHEGRIFGSMHVKCLVVDEEAVLLTSANWTGAAMQDNMEMGVIVAETGIARSVVQHFDQLITAGILAPFRLSRDEFRR